MVLIKMRRKYNQSTKNVMCGYDEMERLMFLV